MVGVETHPSREKERSLMTSDEVAKASLRTQLLDEPQNMKGLR